MAEDKLNRNRYTPGFKKDVVEYALTHNVLKAHEKFGPSRKAISDWIKIYRNGQEIQSVEAEIITLEQYCRNLPAGLTALTEHTLINLLQRVNFKLDSKDLTANELANLTKATLDILKLPAGKGKGGKNDPLELLASIINKNNKS